MIKSLILDEIYLCNKVKNKNSNTVGTVPKPDENILERDKIYTPNTHIRSLNYLARDIHFAKAHVIFNYPQFVTGSVLLPK